jgi:hypothetical protein
MGGRNPPYGLGRLPAHVTRAAAGGLNRTLRPLALAFCAALRSLALAVLSTWRGRAGSARRAARAGPGLQIFTVTVFTSV